MQKPFRVIALTPENCERFGNAADAQLCCFLFKKIGHKKINCLSNLKKSNSSQINLLSEDVIFEERTSDESENELNLENF